MPAAAVLSFSATRNDPRVFRQISWLIEGGYVVENHGLGDYLIPNPGAHYRIKETKKLGRIREYLENRPEKRAAALGRQLTDLSFLQKLSSGYFSLVILNDLEFLGVPEIEAAASASNTPIIVDLHEFFPDTGDGFIWQLLHGRYYKFLLEKLSIYKAFKFITVSEEIASFYREEFGLPFSVIMNIPALELSPEDVGKTPIGPKVKLIHHGIWNPRRGILRLIRSMTLVDTDKTLTLMLVASPTILKMLRAYIWVLGLRRRVLIVEPASFNKIIPTLRNFDAEVIFYHPPHSKNEFYSLPNKFFEAIAAELPLVVGQSPSMAKIVMDHDIGLVTQKWSHRGLAATLNIINQDNLVKFRENLKTCREIFSSLEMRRRFLEICASANQEAGKARGLEK